LTRRVLCCIFSLLLTAGYCRLAQAQPGGQHPLFDRTAFDTMFSEEAQPSTAATQSPPAQPGAQEQELFGPECDLPEFPPEPQYSQQRWNEMRRDVESGAYLRLFDVVEVSNVAVSTAPQELPPSLEMPGYGTSMSVTGRKTLGFSFNSKRYLNEQTTTRPQTLSTFDLQQQLQVRMQGKVGPRITVNIDYDDTRTDKQDISISYKGEDTDVVQNASFGDIDLSLPSSEFVQYNKQLFGIRMDVKYGGLRGIFIGSRTKGTTKTKEFVGNTAYQGKDILDTQYLRRQYYDLSFGSAAIRLPIKQGSEKVYLDNQSYLTANNVDVFDMTADDLGIETSSYTGRFRLLAAGVDYTVDYVKGIMKFRGALGSQDVVAVNFINADGTELRWNSSTFPYTANGTGLYKIAKTIGDVPISSDTQKQALELGYQREMKTYYSVGQTQIVRDDGRGNFMLKVQDLNRNNTGEKLNPPQYYPDYIDVDFENGIFNLKKPFGSVYCSTCANPPQDPDIYAPTPVSKYIIRAEFISRVKTFYLEPRIVSQSESVVIDGSKLNRNLDYYIDYDSGYITFYNESRIQSSSKIDVTYDVSPFGGLGTSSLVGTRVSYDLNSHVSVGGTALYQTAAKSSMAPDISDVAKSLFVYEADAHFNDISPLSFLKASFALEAAQSKSNPNLNGFALIDNMEGVKQQDSAPMQYDQWQMASNPTLGPADPAAVGWYTEKAPVLSINPGAQSSPGATQDVLDVNYDLSVSSETSIVYPFSDSGLDFSQKNMLELVVYADGTPMAPAPQLNIHLGQINEDSDNAGGMTLRCANGATLYNAPKTEDLNCNGQLDQDEDIGWLYSPALLSTKRYGAKNGRVDAQDLNHNGRLDSQDFSGGDFGYVGIEYPVFTDTNDSNAKKAALDFTGWHTLQVPIVIPSTAAYNWSSIKQMRISLKRSPLPGARTQGTIKFARLSVTGTSWTVATSTVTQPGTVTLSGENNVDNPEYTPIFSAGGEAQQVFGDLYGSVSEMQQATNSKNLSEQSLQITYTSTGPARVAAQRRFTNPIDISQHGQFRFLVNNPTGALPAQTEISTTTMFFVRIGDDANYQEASFPLDFTGWRLYVLNQEDVNGDQISDFWTNGCNYTVNIASAGLANFQQVSLLTAGIRATDGNTHTGTVWLDEIHVGAPRSLTGNARMVKADFSLGDWIDFGGKYRFLDRNFETPVSVSSRQDNEQDTAYGRLKKFSFLPVEANYTRQVVTTPNTLNTGNNNFVNSLQQGTVRSEAGNVNGQLILGALPRFNGGYSFNQTKYEMLTRLDDRHSYTGGMTYAAPFQYGLKSLELGYTYAASKTTFDSMQVLVSTGYYNSNEITNAYSAKAALTPWAGSSLAPAYSLTKVDESRDDFTSGAPVHSSYHKSMQVTAGFTGNLKLLSWLNPSVNYSATNIENNNLSVTTVTVGANDTVYGVGQIKTVNRTANGGINLNLNMADILPGVKPLRTLNLANSYQLQDGDSWQNVEQSLNTANALWLRSSLKPENPYAQRTNLTLRDTYSSTQKWQPLDAYDMGNRLSPLKTLSITNNYSTSITRTEVTGTASRVVTTTLPDLVTTLSQVENFFGAPGWMNNAVVNLKYSNRLTNTEAVSAATDKAYGADLRFLLMKWMDTLLSCNIRTSEQFDLRVNQSAQNTLHRDATLQGTFDIRKFCFTPKVDYNYDETLQGASSITQQTTTITPALMVRADLNLPKGLLLPFMSKPLMFTNRIIWTNNLSYEIKRSPVTVMDNANTLNFTTTADCELAKNLRLTVNGALQRLWHKYLPQEDFIAYQAGSMMTLQF